MAKLISIFLTILIAIGFATYSYRQYLLYKSAKETRESRQFLYQDTIYSCENNKQNIEVKDGQISCWYPQNVVELKNLELN